MEDVLFKTCFITATALTGMLCGASLDQSVKQLPARRVIGVKAFSAYARAADLKNGIPFYAILGVGAALTAILAAILAWIYHKDSAIALPVWLAGILAICHTFCTTQAAPTYFKLKKTDNEEALKKLLDKFERIQTIRSAFILLNFLCYIWAVWILFV
ncbi:MAG: hypothetical protein JWO03_3180 [Bacteroidetes bacterium]|nr:hypothetical protein [Bacteroidota bacterium]